MQQWRPGQGALLVQCNGNGEIGTRVFQHPQQGMEDKMIKDKMIEYVIPIAILFGTTAPALAADY